MQVIEHRPLHVSRRIIFWGIGNICRMCHLGCPDIQVDGYIDSNYEDKTWNGKTVIKPDQVDDWHAVYIVITILQDKDIKTYLNEKGLQEGTDYSDYRSFFHIKEAEPFKDLNRISEKVEKEKLQNKTLLFAPVFISRASDELIHFFKEYASKRSCTDYVLITGMSAVSEKRSEEIIGFPTICHGNEPEIRSKLLLDKENDELTVDIDKQEKENVYRIVNEITNGKSDESAIYEAVSHYGYYRRIIEILRPQKMLFWGGWTKESFYLDYIAKRSGIKMVHLEHGSIPGTIQSDKKGIAGYGEICRGSQQYRNTCIDNSDDVFDRVKNRIIQNKTDTGVFRELRNDKQQLSKINKSQKTVFLVGTGSGGWDVEENSLFWKKHVSSEFMSRRAAYETTKELCHKNGWNLIYKPHPGSYDSYCEADMFSPDIAVVRYAQIDDLIELSDVVVTLISAVSYKVLFYEKPLVEIGKHSLYAMGCSYEVHGDYEKKLKEALKKGMLAEHKAHFREHIIKLLHYNHWDDLTHDECPYGKLITEDIL